MSHLIRRAVTPQALHHFTRSSPPPAVELRWAAQSSTSRRWRPNRSVR